MNVINYISKATSERHVVFITTSVMMNVIQDGVKQYAQSIHIFVLICCLIFATNPVCYDLRTQCLTSRADR